MSVAILRCPTIRTTDCVESIVKEIRRLKTVNEVKADVHTKVVQVDLVAGASLREVRDKLNELNYPAALPDRIR